MWSDGQPITSHDFKYSAEQGRASGTLTSPPSAVDDTDPKTAVVTWSEPAAGWRDQFNRILPEPPARGQGSLGRNARRLQVVRRALDHRPLDQGPGDQACPRTSRYWGQKPHLDAVVFKIIPDAAAYLAAQKTGQVDMIFVQGAQPEVLELKGLPNTELRGAAGPHASSSSRSTRPSRPSTAVPSGRRSPMPPTGTPSSPSSPGRCMPGIKPTQAFMSPANKKWYSEPFASYRRDLRQVTQLMTGDGWAKGGDGIWTKGGTKARVELNTMVGNRRRELTAEILQSQWKEAGFEVAVNNTASQTLLGDWHPKGTFQASISGTAPTTTEVNSCGNFCTRFIPTEANRFQGGNFSQDLESGA